MIAIKGTKCTALAGKLKELEVKGIKNFESKIQLKVVIWAAKQNLTLGHNGHYLSTNTQTKVFSLLQKIDKSTLHILAV